MQIHHLFPKTERLCSKKDFELLFNQSNSFYDAFFKILWIFKSNTIYVPTQISISIPKRLIKKAVTRNLIRRRIKETYRLHKDHFNQYLKTNNISVACIILYNRKDIVEYKQIEENIIHSLKKLEHEVGVGIQHNQDNRLSN